MGKRRPVNVGSIFHFFHATIDTGIVLQYTEHVQNEYKKNCSDKNEEVSMNHNDQDARNRIMKAAVELLDETEDIENITVRQIAKRAGVGIGLINYHFHTKDNMLKMAVGDVMAKMAGEFIQSDQYSGQEPVQKIKAMLKSLYNYGERHHAKLMQFVVSSSILSGDMQAQLYLVPVLREIFQEHKDEMQLRIIALQILLPLQVAALNPPEFHLYSGIDLDDEAQRNDFIDALVDELVK